MKTSHGTHPPSSPRLAALLPLLAAIALIPVAEPASAQDELPPLSTDRPGQSTSPSILSTGYLQLEAGAQIAAIAPGAKSYALPLVLARIGLLPAMELRLGAEYRSLRVAAPSSGAATAASGIASVSAGAKIAITPEQGAIPETALLLTLALPYGSGNFRPAAVAPSFLLAMRSSPGGPFNLYYNLGGSWDGSSGAGTGLYTLALSATIAGDLSAFAELYGSLGSGLPPAHAADAGIAYPLSPNLQLDLSGGAGITQPAPEYFINAGISLRLPR